MCNFKLGEKVVCVDNSGVPELVVNEIYTIEFIDANREIAFKIKELNVYNSECDAYYIYMQWRFRKLDWQFGHDICDELSRQYNEEFIEL